MGVAICETMKEFRLLPFRDWSQGEADGLGRNTLLSDIRRGLCGRSDEVGVDAKEFVKGFQPAAQRADT